MPIHKESLTRSRAANAAISLLNAGQAVCLIWECVRPVGADDADAWRLVFASCDVDPATGTDYRPLQGRPVEEAFPGVGASGLVAVARQVLEEQTSRDLAASPQTQPLGGRRVTLTRVEERLAGLLLHANGPPAGRGVQPHTVFGDILETCPQGALLLDDEGRILETNEAGRRILGRDRADLEGTPFLNIPVDDDGGDGRAALAEVLSGERVAFQVQGSLRRPSGDMASVDLSASRLGDDGEARALVMISDVTARQEQQERALQQLAEEAVERSTPVMQVWPGVVLAPLIGVLDSERTERFMEALLTAISDSGSRVALIDITGVPTIDTQTAQNLIESIRAARLLGARVILTGVRPAIAQTLVQLGIDLGTVNSLASLGSGLAMAMDVLKKGAAA